MIYVPIFITDVYMFTYFYNKNVPIITIQSPYFYNGLSGSVPIFINSRCETEKRFHFCGTTHKFFFVPLFLVKTKDQNLR